MRSIRTTPATWSQPQQFYSEAGPLSPSYSQARYPEAGPSCPEPGPSNFVIDFFAPGTATDADLSYLATHSLSRYERTGTNSNFSTVAITKQFYTTMPPIRATVKTN
eukprot:753323-Rhodomonas_salina.1